MPPSHGRSITDFFKARPPPKKQRTDDEVYDNIVVGGSSQEDLTTKRAWPTRKRAARASSSNDTSTPARRSRADPEKAVASRSTSSSPNRLSTAPVTPGDAQSGTSPSTPVLERAQGQPDTANISGQPPTTLTTAATATVSFTSTLSFSSANHLSQSTIGSSRRVVIGGMQGVTASESEDDDDEDSSYAVGLATAASSDTDDDEDDVAILGAIYAKPKPPITPQSSTPVGGRNLRSRGTKSKGSVLKPKKPTYDQTGKYSLASLVARQTKAAAQDHEMALARSKIDAMDTSDSHIQSESALQDGLNEDILAALVDDDGDGRNAARLRVAMERTEVLQQEDTWHFFNTVLQAPERQPWPDIKLTGWLALLNDEGQREEMLQSGFIASMADKVKLPDQILLWMLNQVWSEPRDDLCHAYFAILKSTQSCKLCARQLLDPDHFRAILCAMGAKNDALLLDQKLTAQTQAGESPVTPAPVALQRLISLLGSVACVNEAIYNGSSPPQWAFITEIVIRISLDETVQNDGYLQSRLSWAVSNLLDAVEDEDIQCSKLLKSLYSTIQTPLLKLRLLKTLPSQSVRTHTFRRRLALAFLLGNPEVLEPNTDSESATDLTSPQLFARILDLLRTNPTFAITRRTDYTVLQADLIALDIAIDAGFSDFAFLSNASTSDKETSQNARDEERTFNGNISALAAAVRAIEQQIHDVGAANMTKTIAKEKARRLVARLEYAARTKEKRRTNLFSSKNEEDDEREFLQKWVLKSTKAAPASG